MMDDLSDKIKTGLLDGACCVTTKDIAEWDDERCEEKGMMVSCSICKCHSQLKSIVSLLAARDCEPGAILRIDQACGLVVACYLSHAFAK